MDIEISVHIRKGIADLADQGITILLPTLGMMMFPIFTTYILQEYTHKKESDQ